MLYDADKVKEAASVEDEKDLYESQLTVFLDPNDPEVAAEAKKQGIPEEWIKAAQESPIYKMIIDWKNCSASSSRVPYNANGLVYPPLSPIMNMVEGKGSNWQAEEIFPAIDNMRIPIQYLANLLTAGDESHIRLTLKKWLSCGRI